MATIQQLIELRKESSSTVSIASICLSTHNIQMLHITNRTVPTTILIAIIANSDARVYMEQFPSGFQGTFSVVTFHQHENIF